MNNEITSIEEFNGKLLEKIELSSLTEFYMLYEDMTYANNTPSLIFKNRKFGGEVHISNLQGNTEEFKYTNLVELQGIISSNTKLFGCKYIKLICTGSLYGDELKEGKEEYLVSIEYPSYSSGTITNVLTERLFYLENKVANLEGKLSKLKEALN